MSPDMIVGPPDLIQVGRQGKEYRSWSRRSEHLGGFILVWYAFTCTKMDLWSLQHKWCLLADLFSKKCKKCAGNGQYMSLCYLYRSNTDIYTFQATANGFGTRFQVMVAVQEAICRLKTTRISSILHGCPNWQWLCSRLPILPVTPFSHWLFSVRTNFVETKWWEQLGYSFLRLDFLKLSFKYYILWYVHIMRCKSVKML